MMLTYLEHWIINQREKKQLDSQNGALLSLGQTCLEWETVDAETETWLKDWEQVIVEYSALKQILSIFLATQD